MLKNLISAGVLLMGLSQSVISQQGSGAGFVFSGDYNDNVGSDVAAYDCEARFDRREIITKYNLPYDLRFQGGYTTDKWGSFDKGFCYLEYSGNVYIQWIVPFYVFNKPIKVLKR